MCLLLSIFVKCVSLLVLKMFDQTVGLSRPYVLLSVARDTKTKYGYGVCIRQPRRLTCSWAKSLC